MNKKTTTVALSKVLPDPKNPRQDFPPNEMRSLEESIKKQGILMPLTVEEQKDGTYLLVDGERRYRTAKKLKLHEVPVSIMEPMSVLERMKLRFHLQEQHSQWTAWEKAVAVDEFIKETGMTKDEAAEILGLSHSQVRHYEAIRNLSKRTVKTLNEKKLSFSWMDGIGRILAATKNEELRGDLEDALIQKVDDKVIVRSGELQKYGIAVRAGGEPIVKKIIREKNYGPTHALHDAGVDVQQRINTMSALMSNTIRIANMILSEKHLVLSESNHNAIMRTLKVLTKLGDIDYEKGLKSRKGLKLDE